MKSPLSNMTSFIMAPECVKPFSLPNKFTVLSTQSINSSAPLPFKLHAFKPHNEKTVFGVSDQVRLKPACSATETS